MPAIPTVSRPTPAKHKASCPMCRLSAALTIGEMAAYSTAASLRMTKTATPFAVQLSKCFAANLWELSAEVAMHQRATTFRAASPLRRGLAAHAAAREGRDNAMAPLSGGTSLRRAQVPHLRPSTIPATRTDGRADRNEPGHLGLQPETHAEGAGWSCFQGSAGLLTKQAHLRATTPTP